MARRPTTIHCHMCNQPRPSHHAREAQLAWARPFDGDGSHTDPQALDRLHIYVCATCWTTHEVSTAPLPETRDEALTRARAALDKARNRQEALI